MHHAPTAPTITLVSTTRPDDDRRALEQWADRVSDYLADAGRPHELADWDGDGRPGMRLRVETVDDHVTLTYWVRAMGGGEWWVGTDDADTAEPTPFARRTARVFTGLDGFRHIVGAQATAYGDR